MESEIQEILLSQFAEDDLNEIIEYHFSMSRIMSKNRFLNLKKT